MVVAAPREIHDHAYRACRVAGASSAEARAVASSTALAEIHLTGAVDRLVALLSSGAPPPPIGRLALAGGGAADGLAVADLVDVVVGDHRSGLAPTLVCGDGERRPFDKWFRTGCAALEVASIEPGGTEVEPGVLRAIDDRTAEAHRLGVTVDDSTWTGLLALAEPYLIPESTLDAADDAPVVD